MVARRFCYFDCEGMVMAQHFQALGHPIFDTAPCVHCGRSTAMLATKLCDRCWELDRRMRADPTLAKKILAAIERDKS